jgi:hypothetical protein
MKKLFNVFGMQFVTQSTKNPVGRPKKRIYSINPTRHKPKNGHRKTLITRALTASEKELIKQKFVKWNGIVKEDASKILKRAIPEASIFQITGVIVHLHRQVKIGVIQLRDPSEYHDTLDARRRQWATWNSPKYQALNQKLNGPISFQSVVPSGITFNI